MEAVRKFKAPKKSFGDLDAEAAAALLAAASDVALVIDAKGVIRDLAFSSEDFSQQGYGTWIGQPWASTVTVESRPKVEELLRDAALPRAPRWRQVNHPSARGADVPVLYSMVPVGKKGWRVAIGRDMRAIASLQQQLVGAQQAMERDYSRLRQTETRYRLLFQIAAEPVLILDASTQKVIEANPAATELLATTAKNVLGQTFPVGFDADSTRALQRMLASIRSTGRADELRVRLADRKTGFMVSASLFRQENAEHLLVRLSPVADGAATALVSGHRSKLLQVVEQSPDGFVVTGPDGNILTANRAFLDMAQLTTEEQARGQSLDRWLGRPGVDLGVLAANLRQHGSVRLFATTLRGEYGYITDVEISAVAVVNVEQPCLGFTIRNVSRRLATDTRSSRQLPRSVEQLTELIGRVSLKELVREATDVIERLCIEAALELTGDNRASAAEMLGLSRQSLYVKLRRYGLGDLDSDDEK